MSERYCAYSPYCRRWMASYLLEEGESPVQYHRVAGTSELERSDSNDECLMLEFQGTFY
jgi:hypothetical protein